MEEYNFSNIKKAIVRDDGLAFLRIFKQILDKDDLESENIL